MAQSKEHDRSNNLFAWAMRPAFSNPMVAILADMNGTFLDGLATAQTDWAKFVQRRITENVAVTRQLLSCQSLADAHEIYARYLETAFHHYREQTQKLVQRGETMAQHLAETTETNAREAARTRH